MKLSFADFTEVYQIEADFKATIAKRPVTISEIRGRSFPDWKVIPFGDLFPPTPFHRAWKSFCYSVNWREACD